MGQSGREYTMASSLPSSQLMMAKAKQIYALFTSREIRCYLYISLCCCNCCRCFAFLGTEFILFTLLQLFYVWGMKFEWNPFILGPILWNYKISAFNPVWVTYSTPLFFNFFIKKRKKERKKEKEQIKKQTNK